MPSIVDRCPVCGFDPSTVSPGDAAVAARSFPRRYRNLLVRPEGEQDVVFRRTEGGPSAVDIAAAAAADMDAAAAAVRAASVRDRPPVSVTGSPRSGDRTLDAVLAALDAGASALADAIDGVDGRDWDRIAILDGGEVRALDLARAGVHAGAHGRREVERAIARAR